MSDTRRQYSDAEKATALAALAANSGDLRGTARTIDIPKSTLEQWANKAASATTDDKKKNLADELEAIALKLVAVMPDKIQAATLQQIATSLGITVDKMQLLRGKATERSEVVATIEVQPIDYRSNLTALQPPDE